MVLFQGQKRHRDEDEDEFDEVHLEKRFRSTPPIFKCPQSTFDSFAFQYPRSTPTYTRTFDAFLTPISPTAPEPFRLESRDESLQSPPSMDIDIDMDSDSTSSTTSPSPSTTTHSTFARPARPTNLTFSNPTSSTPSTDRLPTPINNAFLRPPSLHRSRTAPGGLSLNTLRLHSTQKMQHPQHQQPDSWMLMPSPISEDETPTTPNESAEIGFARLSMRGMDGMAMSVDSGEPLTPVWKGRARSGAIVADGRGLGCAVR